MEDHYKDLDAEFLLARKWSCQLNFSINEDGEIIDLYAALNINMILMIYTFPYSRTILGDVPISLTLSNTMQIPKLYSGFIQRFTSCCD